jgi:hypothetical protein
MYENSMRVEVRICTSEMHRRNELGAGAQASSARDQKEDAHVKWLRDLIEITATESGAGGYPSDTSMTLYQDRVFAFTPKGALFELPKGATPVDFAFAVHTELGLQTAGVKINGRHMPLNAMLSNGDVVEIIRSEDARPQLSWLGFVMTSKARMAIRRAVRLIDPFSILTNASPPEQIEGVTSYTTNKRGQITRANVNNEGHLKDVPSQREMYNDIRLVLVEMLQDHGPQRLGSRLSKRVEELLEAMPEDFEVATAYPIWRSIRRLNAILHKHDLSDPPPNFDANRLDPICVVDLRELVDFCNNFNFGDDGLRANDLRTVPPQLRSTLAQEAKLAEPLMLGLCDSKDLIDDHVADDIQVSNEIMIEEVDGPFSDQLRERASMAQRNIMSAFITSIRKFSLKHAKSSASEIRKGAESAVGSSGLKYLSENFDNILRYSRTAFEGSGAEKILNAIKEIFSSFLKF